MKKKRLVFFVWTLVFNESVARAQVFNYHSPEAAEFADYAKPQDVFANPSTTKWSESDVKNTNLDQSQILEQVSGLQFVGSQSMTNQSFFIRGAASEETLVLWNGIEINDPASGSVAANPLDVQSEFSNSFKLYKGPQSLIFGSQGLGGVLDWQKSSWPESRVWVKAGSLQNQQAILEFQKNFEASETMHGRWGLGGSYASIQGLSSSSDSSISENDRRVLHRGSGFLELDLGPLTRFEFWALSSDQSSEDDLFGRQDIDARSSRRWQAGRATLKQKISPQDQVSIETQNIQSNIENRNDGQNAYLEKANGERNKNSFLWSHSSENFETIFHVDNSFEQMKTDFFDQHQTVQGLAAGVSSQNKKYQFGLRLDKFNSIGDQYLSEWSYHLQFRQPLTDQPFEFFELLGVGHRFPTLYQRYSQLSGNINLQSEKVQSVELGLSWAASSKWQMQSSLFQNNYSSMIAYDYTSSRYENWSRVLIHGIEGQIQYQDMLTQIRGSATVLEAYDQISKQALPRRPQLMAQALWVQSWVPNWSSTTAVTFCVARPDQDLQGNTELPTKWGMDVVVKYQATPRWSSSLSVENLWNDRSAEVATYEVAPRSFHILTEAQF